MRLLNSIDLNEKLVSLIKDCDEIYIMTAWATERSQAYKALFENKKKIKKAIVGTHFYQTTPSFIRSFFSEKSVRFFKQTDGVFHPKVYLFINKVDSSCCMIIGSSNFTQGGLGKNYELSMIVKKNIEDPIIIQLLDEISSKFNEASYFTEDELNEYEIKWKYNKPIRAKLAVQQRLNDEEDVDSGVSVDILNLTWNEYVRLVESDDFHSLKGRLKVLKAAKKIFFVGFENATDYQKSCIEGLIMDNVDDSDEDSCWAWFGHMKRAKSVYSNSKAIEQAIDCIPNEGEITEEIYNEYLEKFKLASSSKNPIGTATRLLCMKRPDFFVCIDTPNNKNLSSAFGFGKKINCKNYWNFLKIVHSSRWWNEAPKNDLLSPYRAALLDAAYYDPSQKV